MIERSFDAAAKGVPFIEGLASGWNLFGDHTTLPAAVILGDVLQSNCAIMADYCRRNGVLLAPHGKTTMSPELFELQIRAARGRSRRPASIRPVSWWTRACLVS